MQTIDGKDVYTVTEVNYFARQRLEEMTFWVEGEISECKRMGSYNFFSLTFKDSSAILPCVANGEVLKGKENQLQGKKAFAYGYLTLYEPRGNYQFRINKLEEAGRGLLQRQLEELIKKLMAEGIFDERYKKPIPAYPTKVCIVTSQGSAAWNDFKKNTVDQFKLIELYTADVRVQGPQSIEGILKVLPKVDAKEFDVIVITRGGGSIEDLAAFNDEKVARTIFKMKTPTIVAIGHEHNQSLAEWVADMRASTPTGAANIITLGYYRASENLKNYKRNLADKFDHLITNNIQTLEYFQNRFEATRDKYTYLSERLSKFKMALYASQKHLMSDSAINLSSLYKSLILLSPTNTLKRGYSITTDESGKVVRSAISVVVGTTIGVKLAQGKLTGKITAKQQ